MTNLRANPPDTSSLRERLAEVLAGKSAARAPMGDGEMLDIADFVYENSEALARALEDAERWRGLVELTRKNWSVTADAPNGLTYQYIGDRLVLAIDAARKKP